MTFADYILRHDPFVKLVFSLVPGEEKLLKISIHKSTW